jgi:hypothetical protein
MYNYIFRCKYKLDAPRSLNRSPDKTTPYDPYAKCNFHRWFFFYFKGMHMEYALRKYPDGLTKKKYGN